MHTQIHKVNNKSGFNEGVYVQLWRGSFIENINRNCLKGATTLRLVPHEHYSFLRFPHTLIGSLLILIIVCFFSSALSTPLPTSTDLHIHHLNWCFFGLSPLLLPHILTHNPVTIIKFHLYLTKSQTPSNTLTCTDRHRLFNVSLTLSPEPNLV